MRTFVTGLVAAGLVGICLVTAPAPSAQGSVGAPPPGARFGDVLVPAGSWLDGLGVAVYSNGSSRYFCDPGARSGCGSHFGARRTYVGVKWQCVELAQRLYTARGWHTGSFGVAYAFQIWWAAPRLAMLRRPNGTLRPRDVRPGDMIVWGPGEATGRAGHVAVVDFVSGSQVWVKEQNWGPGSTPWNAQRGQTVYSLAGGWLSGHAFPPDQIYGIVHSPNDHLLNPPPDVPMPGAPVGVREPAGAAAGPRMFAV